jgi:ABC-type dipeptide/oligopeptide/nickel transport system ATPase subunit
MEGLLIENISKNYTIKGHRNLEVLSSVNIHINPGEFVSLLGESGSGKSTLAKLIMGIERPSSGKIILNNQLCDFASHKARKTIYKKIQAVFQDASGTLNPRLSAYHNVEEALVSLTNLSSSDRKFRIKELMDLLEMNESLLKRHVWELSGGEQRRLSLLRALAIKPEYLVLDEVISGLDRQSIQLVEGLLLKCKNDFGCGVIYITHHNKSAYRLSDRILKLKEGYIICEGHVQSIDQKKEQNILYKIGG